MLHSPLAIGNVFRRLRKRHLDKPSLRDAAEVIGVSHSTLGSLETGASHHWTRERIATLCKFYGVTLEDFDAMCKAEDQRLDNPARSIHDPDADPEEVARYKQQLAAVNPTSQKINALHFTLADELPPKLYLAELNAIALKHGLGQSEVDQSTPQTTPQTTPTAPPQPAPRSFKVKHPEREDPDIKGAIVQDFSHYELDDDGQPKKLGEPSPQPKRPKNPPVDPPSKRPNKSG